MGRKKWAVTITIEEKLAEPTKTIAFANHLTISKLINFALLHLYESPEGKYLIKQTSKTTSNPLLIQSDESITMTYDDALEKFKGIESRKIAVKIK
jgi:hypothetical protein